MLFLSFFVFSLVFLSSSYKKSKAFHQHFLCSVFLCFADLKLKADCCLWQCYMALAKGGLVADHVLILPIHHHRCTVTAPSDVLQEIETYPSPAYRSHLSRDCNR